jgi:glycosyltransferase involved in cell wall biosynthesis
MKRFVIVTQYYPPEIGGGSQRSVGFAEGLHDLGMEIIVITPFPSYLMSKDKLKTNYKLFEKIEENGYTIYRTFVYASDRGNYIKRILYYGSFMLSSLFVMLFKVGKINYILTIAPPLFTGITGVFAKKFKKSKFFFDIGDLWPESATALGYLKNDSVIRLAQKLEHWIYRHADMVNVVTKLTNERLSKSHSYIKKILYVPNFVNTDLIKHEPRDPLLIEKYKLQDKLVFGYAGNIGSAQGLKIITDAAKLTKEYKEITYFIIGDGVEKDLIEKEIKINDLTNVILIPPVSRTDVIKYIMLFDVMIIPLVHRDIFKITIPSKLYESMAAEIPILLCVDGEARKIMEEAKCGIFVEPENDKMLSEKVMYFRDNRSIIKDLGKNGREEVFNSFSRSSVVKRFYDELIKLS